MTTMYRFRDRLPKNGEGKAPRAELAGAIGEDGVGRLFLYDVIDSWGGYWGVSAGEFAAALAELGDQVSEIHLHVNSPGGEVYEAIAIKNLLANHSARVVAHVDGIAASAASFVAVAADELVMGENSELMIHDAMLGAFGNAADHRGWADDLDRVSDNIASIYAKKSGTDAADWRAVMIEEKWFSAQEAVDAGLADSVAGAEPTADEDPEAIADRLRSVALAAVGAKATSRQKAGAPERVPAPRPAAAIRAAQFRHSFRERSARR